MIQRLVWCAILVAIPALSATIDPCPTATVAFYQQLANGCSEDPFVLKHFTYTSESGGNAVFVDPNDVTLSPNGIPGQVGISFASDKFSVTSDQFIRITLEYRIDPPPPILDAFSLSMSAQSPIFPGEATIDALVCVGSFFDASAPCREKLNLHTFDNGETKILFDTVAFQELTNKLDIILTIDLHANNSVSQIDGGGTGATVIPEPGTALLAMLGLSGLIVRRIRRT